MKPAASAVRVQRAARRTSRPAVIHSENTALEQGYMKNRARVLRESRLVDSGGLTEVYGVFLTRSCTLSEKCWARQTMTTHTMNELLNVKWKSKKKQGWQNLLLGRLQSREKVTRHRHTLAQTLLEAAQLSISGIASDWQNTRILWALKRLALDHFIAICTLS